MKKWLEPLVSAWEGIKHHKLRSSLTMLGIVIGVAAVIGLMSIGRGVQAQILSNIESLGSNLVTITPGSFTQGGVRSAAGSASTLTLEDATAIADQVPSVAVVAPYSQSSAQLVAGSANTRAQVMGVTPDYQQAYNLKTAQGAFLSDYDYETGAKVAVIGANVKTTLFEGVSNPVGQKIRMGSSVVTVMGVLESKGTSVMGSTDDAVIIPLSTLQQTLSQQRTSNGGHVVSSIALSLASEDQSDTVVNETTALLRSRHDLATGDENDFTIRSMDELVSTISDTTDTMTLFLGLMAGIALLVGGIGVMNIMLVSVVERTREIGIRKALGARERDIWGQFLTESAVLSFSGGLIGIGVGLGVSKIISAQLITTLVSPDIIILAVSVSIGIGILFGFLPARRAARLNPIEALRYE
jgi:putative ABC transport system permease protein